MQMFRTHWYIGVFVVLLALLAWLAYTHTLLEREHAQLAQALHFSEAQVDDLTAHVAEQEAQLEAHQELLRVVRRQSVAAQHDFSQMRALVAEATQTVADIKRLEEADTELLAKYSKVYFLNEHYVPESLTAIASEYVLSDRVQRVHTQVLPFLRDMLAAMERDGLSPRVISAYRSYGYQAALKQHHQVTYGTTRANEFVADQGYSEHQLGTAVDLVNTAIGTDMLAFDTTPEYQWLVEHAHRYGFTLSYPEGNSFYAFEPWHWRFVGVALATRLHEEGMGFYDMPQRDINAYRVRLFEQPDATSTPDA